MRHVIVMRVRPQERDRRRPPSLDGLEERREVGTGVDEQRRATLLRRERVCVREPLGMHAALDEHGS